jgi:YHS domain-containing protein
MLRKSLIPFAPLVAITVVYLAGCSTDTPSGGAPTATAANTGGPPATPAPAPANEGEHAHRPGAHGGDVVEIGRDNYHAEPVFEAGGTLRLYMLGQNDARVLEVEDQTLTAYVKPEGGTEAVSFSLQSDRQDGDAPGKTSRFVGAVPKALAGKTLEVTVPSIRIAGERFRFSFTSAAAAHDEGVPAKLAGDAERALYLTPGGLYTEADIKANGGVTASEKFQGTKAAHDLKPRPGDPICPITLTKANAKVTWVVGGKTYEFCCPPCVDEFVTMAKEHPEQVKEPGDYVKK